MAKFKELPQVEFSVAAQNAFKKIFQFNGRIRRSEYWWGVLALFLANIVAILIPFIGILVVFALYIASASLLFRRLHDTGRSGWWCGAAIASNIVALIIFATSIDFASYISAANSHDIEGMTNAIIGGFTSTTAIIAILLNLASIVLSIIILIFLLQDSQPVANKYGDSPKYVLDSSEL